MQRFRISSAILVAGLCGILGRAAAQTTPTSAQAEQPPAQAAVPNTDFPAAAQSSEQTAQSGAAEAAGAKNFHEVVDRTINSEHALVARLKGKQPVVETYIQQMKQDTDMGLVPEHDFYFLGKLELAHGMMRQSYLPPDPSFMRLPHFIKTLFYTDYHPLGFAYEIFLDSNNFDRVHYQFGYVRREFLGDVRCIVITVVPRKNSGKGRFAGRIWVEDHDYNIVRLNGTYLPTQDHEFAHFDSWRVNTGPGLWLPAYIYAQEERFSFGPLVTPPMRAQTRLWGYQSENERSEEAFTNLTVETPSGVREEGDAVADNSPVQAQRMWESQAEDNVIDRLERAGLIAPQGEVDKVLETVLNNLEVTNNINLDPPVHVRVLMTTPLESTAVNHTILISRGLVDVLPDEACLAGVLAHELSHVLLGHSINTRYAFADRLMFGDPSTLKWIKVARGQQEEQTADQKALVILKNSPYKDKLPRIGLFLRMLSFRSKDVPHLIRPLLGNRMAETGKDLRLSGLMDVAPELQMRSVEQIAALPLGSRVKVDPWSDQLRLMKSQNVQLLSAKEKMPFQITPFMLHLTREDTNPAGGAGVSGVGAGPVSPGSAPVPE